ncbi:hypothetical protein [Corallococcus silvisoli]|uniref:hypothetical protein n=1 Tax=Corallococcus silvisoli TaxID=2697031 RepID=UPI001378399A|nr:hypothetical protein [Corallococcus silvisoli]NBD09274.1 hypothetical protein [Corallococcus silvisoli]
MMHCAPEEVRSWPWSDVVNLLAYSEQEREEMEKRFPKTGASGSPRTASPSTNTTVYRFGPKPAPKR